MRSPALALTFAWMLTSTMTAQTHVQRGHEIAIEARRRTTGFRDMSAVLRMTLRDKRGTERVRELTFATLEQGTGNRTLVRFERPHDLRGTSLLTVEDGTGARDQWLYLPSLRRVRRIAGSGQAGSFMGSEFSYEDIGTMDPDQYEYRFVRTDSLQGRTAWVVERCPLGKSQYRRQVVWFDQSAYRVLRIDFYDRDNSLLKTLTFGDFGLFEERFWIPGRMEMVNHQTGASTLLQWQEIAVAVGLDSRDFEPSRIARRREP